MNNKHPRYKSKAIVHFAIFDMDLKWGVRVTANTIINYFKPLI